jgi:TATA-box binding protein (TBP) (component of TFIID and TFIIIB)
MLGTNIKIEPSKLEQIFDDIEPISYDEPKDGVIQISVRGKLKGMCKKNRFKRPKKNVNASESSIPKNFRNQVSFYIRILDELPIYIPKLPFEKTTGFYHKKVIDIEPGTNLYSYRRGTTAFQFKRITLNIESDNVKLGSLITLFTSVTRKTQENQLQFIEYKLTESDIEKKCVNFDFPEGKYAHSLYIKTENIDISVNVEFVMEINMFMFTSGKIKVAGCTKEYQIDRAINVLISDMKRQLSETQMTDLFGEHINDFKVISKTPVMINSDFTSDYKINRWNLDNLIRSKYKVMSSFESGTHPAVIIKYFTNDSYDTKGKCLCKNHGFDKSCCGRSNGHGIGNCKTVTILVFQSGSIILTGGRLLNQVEEGFEFINNVLKTNKSVLNQTA